MVVTLVVVGLILWLINHSIPMDATIKKILNAVVVVQAEGRIRYVSGGVGESGRTDLQALSSEFNLHLMFATPGQR